MHPATQADGLISVVNETEPLFNFACHMCRR